MKIAVFALLSLAILGFLEVSSAKHEDVGDYDILLKSGAIHTAVLDEDALAELSEYAIGGAEEGKLAGGAKYLLVQLDGIPTEEMKRGLEKEGVTLLQYIPNYAWVAKVHGKGFAKIKERALFRWAGKIDASYKLSERLKDGEYGEWNINDDGSVDILVYFFPGVSLEEARVVMEKHRVVVVNTIESLNVLGVAINTGDIESLASEDIVEWMAPYSPPLSALNDGVRVAIKANDAQASPYNVNGTGVTLMVYDGGTMDSDHDDFAGRVAYLETGAPSPDDDHATHVSGTAVGDGTLSGGTYRGVAPNATIVSYEYNWGDDWCVPYCLYDSPNDLAPNYQDAINRGANLATNSIGPNIGPNWYPCSWEGDYEDTAQLVDQISRGSLGEPFLSVWAAGNERGYRCWNHWTAYPGYNTTGTAGTAKSVITVGATNDAGSMASFSSWGPTDDGRIKPDVVAPGVSVYSTVPPDDYDWYSGTSMSTPAVAGSAVLLIQDYKSYHGDSEPMPSTIKALLIHTAGDLGNSSQTGPDFCYGWGMVNITAALDIIRSDNATNNTIEENETQADGEYDNYTITVASGTSNLRITLVWDDYPGTPLASKELVNDLDLIVTSPSAARVYPWLLNATVPTAAATTGVDSINPVEQVYVASPEAGVWTVQVYGKTVPDPEQNYTLVANGDLDYGASIVITPMSSENGSFIQNGTVLTFNITGDSLDSAWWSNDSGATNYSFETNYTINTSSWAGGSVNVTVCANTTSGYTECETYTFTIDNTAPTIALNYPVDNETVGNSTVNFNFTASDNVDNGTDRLACNLSLDGAVNQSVNATSGVAEIVVINGLADGYHDWNVSCSDGAGNSNASEVEAFIVDATAPYIWLNSPPDYYNTSNTTIVFNFTARDNTSSVLSCGFYISGVLNATNTSVSNDTTTTFIVNNFAEGAYTWYVRCADNLSHSRNSATRNFRVDRTGPAITITYPENESTHEFWHVNYTFTVYDSGMVNQSSINITGNVTSFDQGDNCTTSDGGYTYECVVDTNVSDGNNSIAVNARDYTYNENSSSVNFTVNNDYIKWWDADGPTTIKGTADPDGSDYLYYGFDIRLGTTAGNKVRIKLTDWTAPRSLTPIPIEDHGFLEYNSTTGWQTYNASNDYNLSRTVYELWDMDSETPEIETTVYYRQLIPAGTEDGDYITYWEITSYD